MKMYCPQRPSNNSISRATSSGVNAMKLTTTSYRVSSRSFLITPVLLISAPIRCAPSRPGTTRFPLVSRCSSNFRLRISLEQAAEMFPVPPMNSIFMLPGFNSPVN